MDGISIFKDIYNVLIGLEHFKQGFQPFKKETKYKYTIKWCNYVQASIAQLVEHWTGKREDPGSNPASASFLKLKMKLSKSPTGQN